jgi:DNA processing protein
MARGIDTAAHKASLTAGGDTIAVFGSGVDHIYLAETGAWRRTLPSKDYFLSEFPWAIPAPSELPVRNRIISGLSVGVLW